jgi:hypothetical protein
LLVEKALNTPEDLLDRNLISKSKGSFEIVRRLLLETVLEVQALEIVLALLTVTILAGSRERARFMMILAFIGFTARRLREIEDRDAQIVRTLTFARARRCTTLQTSDIRHADPIPWIRAIRQRPSSLVTVFRYRVRRLLGYFGI